MKNTRALVMMGISIVAAIAAVVLAARWINQRAAMSTNKVAVAAMDINLGTRLTPDMIRLADWPAGSVMKGSFADLKTLDTRVVKTTLQRGEAVTEAKLAPVGATGGLSAVVAEGKRAMTVRVNDVVGVAGFALPGNYVDILVSTKEDKNSGKGNMQDLSISKLVLERILVLAVAQEASQNETKPKVVNAVTLEVTPEEAEKLDLARSIGQLSLVLRNQIDLKEADTGGATKKTLLYAEEQPKAAPAKPVHRIRYTRPAADKWCQQILTGAGHIEKCH